MPENIGRRREGETGDQLKQIGIATEDARKKNEKLRRTQKRKGFGKVVLAITSGGKWITWWTEKRRSIPSFFDILIESGKGSVQMSRVKESRKSCWMILLRWPGSY